MSASTPEESDFADQLLRVLCSQLPSFTDVLQLLAQFYKANHYALLEAPEVVSYHFTLSSDIVPLCIEGPALGTASGDAEVLNAPNAAQFSAFGEIQSILIVPITQKLIVILTNPERKELSPYVIEKAKLALTGLFKSYEVDTAYSMKVVESYTDEKLQQLARRSFSVINYHPSEVFLNVFAMFTRTGISTKVGISSEQLLKFMVELRRHYNPVPYHNWFHALDVTQFVFSVISNGKVTNYLEPLEVFGLLLSAICHDTDHNGMNNTFHRNAKTVFAHLAHGNLPPLEHHHSCITMDLSRELLSSLPEADRLRVSRFIVDCIMATDMEQHKQFLTDFGQIEGGFKNDNPEHRRLLAQIILKAADLSNTVRDFEEAARMSAKLSEECHRQGDKEVELGLPVSPMCDRNDTNPMCCGQVGFYKFVAGPLMKELHSFFPELKENAEQYEANLATWERLKKEWEESKNV